MPGTYNNDTIHVHNPTAAARVSALELRVDNQTTRLETLHAVGASAHDRIDRTLQRLNRLEQSITYLHSRVDMALTSIDNLPDGIAEELLLLRTAISELRESKQ